jgi:hypothetical protein
MAERTSQNWKDWRERTLEELLQLPPDELLAALKEEHVTPTTFGCFRRTTRCFKRFLKSG